MVIISLSGFHQKVWFDYVSPLEIPLFHEKTLFHFKLSMTHFEGFSSPVLLMSCPQGPFGSWKIGFFNFSSPLFRASCPQGPLGAGNLTFIFQAWKLCFLTDGSSQKRSGSSQKLPGSSQKRPGSSQKLDRQDFEKVGKQISVRICWIF